jgi:hypothetical protein
MTDTDRCPGSLYAHRTVVATLDAEANEDGNLVQIGDTDLGEITEEWLNCTICGIVEIDELEYHGLSDEWEWT